MDRAGLIDEQVWHAESSIMAVSFTQPGLLDWWEHGRQFLIPEFAGVIERVKTTNLVLYDPDTHTWSRPQAGRFGQDAHAGQ